MSSTPAPADRRSYGIALALLAGGSVALLVAFGLTWGSADVPLILGADQAVRSLDVSGRDLYPGAAMAGWVALAAVAGIVATRSWGRTVVAALAVASGAAAAAVAVWFAARSSAVIAEHAGAASGGATPTITSATPAWALALVAGLVVVGAGGWTAVRGRRWPSLGTRYERAPRGERAPSAWEAQDLGRDPTDDLVTGPDPDAETGSSA